MKTFTIITGNNGATYIFNIKNWKSIGNSLQFYKARTLKGKIAKQGLACYLFLKGTFLTSKLKSAFEINAYLQNCSGSNSDFSIDKNCSILISPTTDKVIVHHHDAYFQKFAFGKSYSNVKKETAIYALFPTEKKHFQTSIFFDLDDKMEEIISFKLSNNQISTLKGGQSSENIEAALLEFFKITSNQKCSIKTRIDSIQKNLLQFDFLQSETQKQLLKSIKTNYGSLEFPLGLVHCDFKPWNVLNYSKPLLFDFEEAIINGFPLEDLLNYYIDPIIRYKTTKEVVAIALDNHHLQSYNHYLKELKIEIEFRIFLYLYLIDRMLFWHKSDDTATALCYKKLVDYLISEETFL